jgi:hypothetical protein
LTIVPFLCAAVLLSFPTKSDELGSLSLASSPSLQNPSLALSDACQNKRKFARHTCGSIHESLHPCIMTLLVSPRNLPDTFISSGEESNSDQAQDQRQRSVDSPLAEYDAQIVGRPSEEHLDVIINRLDASRDVG